MGRKKRLVKPMETIWEVNDDLWILIDALIQEFDPATETGRPRTDPRGPLPRVS